MPGCSAGPAASCIQTHSKLTCSVAFAASNMSSRTYSSSSSSSSSSCSSFEQACSFTAPSPQLSTCPTLRAAFEVPAFALNSVEIVLEGGSLSSVPSASTSSGGQSPKIAAERSSALQGVTQQPAGSGRNGMDSGCSHTGTQEEAMRPFRQSSLKWRKRDGSGFFELKISQDDFRGRT